MGHDTAQLSVGLPGTDDSEKMKGTSQTVISRPSGWAPLCFPSSALILEEQEPPHEQSNPYFPLHRDVLRAAVRELLSLDGTIHGESLILDATISCKFYDTTQNADEQVASVDGPRYLQYVDPKRWSMVPDDELLRKKPGRTTKAKRQSEEDSSIRQKKRAKLASYTHVLNDPVEQDTVTNNVSFDTKLIASSQELVDIVVQRARVIRAEEPPTKGKEVEKAMLPLRKVSDADNATDTTYRYSVIDNVAVHDSEDCIEISHFLDLSSGRRRDDGSFPHIQANVDPPTMLEVSIASESILKDACFQMISQMLESIDAKVLRHFLGYKSSALKRDRLLHLIAEYLFDVSHAMFAWEQTEREMLPHQRRMSMLSKKSSTMLQKWDAVICDTLFDERALRKIGGVDSSSLLSQALSIRRLESTDISWETFAQTKQGKRLLSHHRKGGNSLVAVGQKRRGQRVRARHTQSIPLLTSDQSSSDEGRRSRASSIVSTEEALSVHASAEPTIDHPGALLRGELPGVEHISLRKPPGKPWGVLLSKEGDICVVVRAPDTIKDLQCGDMILSVKSKEGSVAYPPSLPQNTELNWFEGIVDLFRTSDVLHLVIRRVISAPLSLKE